MAYDSSISSFTTKTDKVDIVAAAHINAVQTELVTIENILGTNLKGTAADLSTRISRALDPDGSVLSGSAYPSPSFASQQFYRTDLDVYYIRNAANTQWLAQGVSLSNVIYRSPYFPYKGSDLKARWVVSNAAITGVTDNQTLYSNFWVSTNTNAYETIFDEERWLRIPGVTLLTVYAYGWSSSGTNSDLKISIFDGTTTVTGTSATTGNPTTPQLISFTIDVTTLSTSVVSKIRADLRSSGSDTVYCAGIIILGS